MALHSSVDFSMPSAQLHDAPPSSAEILARFEAEQAKKRSSTPLLAGSLAGFSLLIGLLTLLVFRTGAEPSVAAASTTLPSTASTHMSGADPLASPAYINWNLSFEGAQQQAAAQNKPMMVEFYTDWCSVCRGMDATTFTDAAVVAESQNVVPVKINAESRTDLAQRFGIKTYPTFVWVDSSGRERYQVSASYNAPAFIDLMQRNR